MAGYYRAQQLREDRRSFPRAADDFSAAAVGYVAEQVNIAPVVRL